MFITIKITTGLESEKLIMLIMLFNSMIIHVVHIKCAMYYLVLVVSGLNNWLINCCCCISVQQTKHINRYVKDNTIFT